MKLSLLFLAHAALTFTVAATETPPLSHQWRSYVSPGPAFTNIPFATEGPLALPNVQPTRPRYAALVPDSLGFSVNSSPLATLTALMPPRITSEPTIQITTVGASATFAVTATGTAPLAYQWRFNDLNLTDKTNRTLVLVNVQPTHAGNYSVVVANAFGSVTSRVAGLAFTTVHRISELTANPDHTISLGLEGVVPRAFAPYFDLYPIEASTNLRDWSPLVMLQRTSDSTDELSYLDAEATNLDQRYYRTYTNFLVTPFPALSGPYSVGTVSRLLTDPSRTNRYIRTNSSFMATFWYPAEPRAGVLPEAYVENNAELHRYLNERSPGTLARFVSQARPGLPVATNETSYPVVIYSGGATRRQNTDKALELASHGYVVVAMDYPWALASVFPSGRVMYGIDPCFVPRACFQPILDDGLKDIRFVLDELSRLNVDDALFTGRLDSARLGIFGFSLGCVFAAEFCRIDERCKALVLLDGGGPLLELLPDLIRLGIRTPFLSMGSTKDRPASPDGNYNPDWLYTSRTLFTNAVNNAFLCQLQDSGHHSFQDRGSLISDPSRTGNPTVASRAQSQTIRACMVSFFDTYLKEEDDHLLENPAAVHPNIINFQRK